MENQHGNNENPRKNGDEKKPKSNLLLTLIITSAIFLLISSIYSAISDSQYTETKFSEFVADWEAENLDEVELRYDRIIYMTKEEAAKDPDDQKACFTGLPNGDLLTLARELEASGITVNYPITEDNSMLFMILYNVVMFGAIFGLMSLVMKRMGDGGMMGGFGKSRAKVYMEKQTGVTFRDVAGQDEAKESLQEIIDFLHNPQKYT